MRPGYARSRPNLRLMMSDSPANLRVIIIGAGTGGLALAQGLKQAGINVCVYERDRTPREDQGGFRVGISPAGSRALKALVPASVYELFVATCARAPRYFNLLTEQFSELLCLAIEGDAASALDGEKNVIRKTLRRVLLSGLDDQVIFGKKFIAYESNPNGSITARFEDATSASADVLIGADGAGSRVRKQRLPHAQHQDTGIVSIGGKLPMTPQSRALLSDKMYYGMSMIMAPKGLGAIIHSIEFSPGRAIPHFGARWPGFESAIAEDCFGWGLWAARQNVPRDPHGLKAQDQLQWAQELTRHWHPNLRQLIGLTDLATIQSINIRTSVPVAPWESSNVTLLGDAIHTMTPGRGAGANTALRDAAILCQMLVAVQQGRTPLVPALHRYEAEMLRYSMEAVIKSRKQMSASDSIHQPIVGGIQLAGMRAAMRLINALPPVKRQILRRMMRVRGEN
jgi:2-polyprenyl-6-methoxyphenol hydroxylase-like FAD-dependent oxidoreductase